MPIDIALQVYAESQVDDAVVHISEAITQTGYSQPYSIGYDAFDEALMGGVRDGDLVVITGLSGEGKTTLAQNISVNLSHELFPSVWFSYEMIVNNLYAKFKEIGADDEDFLIYTPKRNTTGNVGWIKKKTKEAIDKFNAKFVFIDHIDFLSPTNLQTGDQHRVVLRNICMELKNMAIDMNIVVFLIAHVKKVQGREIEMQDIAESSGIYQLADTVVSVARSYKTEKKNKHGVEERVQLTDNSGVMTILKNRITGKRVAVTYYVDHNKINVWTQPAT
jgi:predicted ATP-dependent serine protease